MHANGFGGTAGQVARASFRPGNAVNGFAFLAPAFVLTLMFGIVGAAFMGQVARVHLQLRTAKASGK